MSTPIFDPEDPRLTAYALGETLDPADQSEVELLLQKSPEARLAMQEIKDLTLVLTAEYDEERQTAPEPAAPLTPNIIALASHLPAERRTWVRPLLAAAAIFLAIAGLASLVPPFNSYRQRASVVAQSGVADPRESSTVAGSGPAPVATAPEPKSDTSIAKINEPFATPADSLEEARAKLAADSAKLATLDKKLAEYPVAHPHTRNDPGSSGQQLAKLNTNKNADASASLPAGAVQELTLPSADPQAKLADLQEPAKEKLNVSRSSANHDEQEQTPMPTTPLNLSAPAAKVVLGLDKPSTSQPDEGGPRRDLNVARAPAPAASVGSSAVTSAPAAPLLAERRAVAGSLSPTSEEFGVPPVDTPDRTNQLAQAEVGNKASAQAKRVDVPQGGAVNGIPRLAILDGRTLYKPEPFGTDKDETMAPGIPATRASALLPAPGFNTAAYDHLVENPFLTAKDDPLSTFSADVDTASYANVRRFIEGGSLPPPDAVRLEEMINYFPYDYAPPAPDSGKAFAVHLEAAACPWAPEHRLVRIGIKGREVATDKRPASNLVFLIDVSGSMEPPERLPLIKRAMSMMVEHLTEQDHVAIVTYAGHSGLALPSTSGEHKDTILAALNRLEAGGGTNGASGITLAYKVAKQNFIKGGTNRVILATDGDFNVGVTSQGELIRLIQNEARSGVFLSALGVGTDNYKDSTMQKLADKGNGNYHYIDRLEEARKVLVDQMGGTLVTIAKDVKIQVEFNPAVVATYRLIGYEKRTLRKEDFNDDRIDAGEIGAGHTVTALYEVVPTGQPLPGAAPAVDALKYGAPAVDTAVAKPEARRAVEADAAKQASGPGEMLTVKMRHKAPDAEASERSYEQALTDHGTPDDFAGASADFKLAAAVADFGLVLRDSPYKGNATLGAALELAQDGKGADVKGYRTEFIELVRKAQALGEGQQAVDGQVR